MSFRKKLLFSLLTLLLLLGLAEILALAAFGLKTGKLFPYERYEEMMRSAAELEAASEAMPAAAALREGLEVIHPYLGFVYDPAAHFSVKEEGFQDIGSPILPADAEALNVAVLGGSFAAHLALFAREELSAALAPLGREAKIVNLALGGYKQPQQLIALSYVLSLGGHFDVVINVDGFNEVALPWVENMQHGVSPFYPRQWHLRIAGLEDPDVVTLALQRHQLRARRQGLARTALRLHLYRSALTAWTWQAVDLRLQRRIEEQSEAVNDAQLEGKDGFRVTGPSFSVPEEGLYPSLAAYWARASRLLDALCRGSGIRYYHFLQPNQYVEGSKPMGAEEKAIAFNPDQRYRASVVAGYPALRRAGEQLAHELAFYDLTMILADRDEVLYRDACCHLTNQGYRIIAEEIGRRIVADFQGRTTAPP